MPPCASTPNNWASDGDHSEPCPDSASTRTPSSSTPLESPNPDNLLKECKKFIQCDAPECQKWNPKHRCGTCRMVHYCSRQCQKNHWRAGHRHTCVPIHTLRDELNDLNVVKDLIPVEADESIRVQVLASSSTSCGICLEPLDNMVRPLVLANCHHTFCFPCLRSWNNHQATALTQASERPSPTCPLCRQTIPNLSQTIFSNARQLLQQAGQLKEGRLSLKASGEVSSTTGDWHELCREAIHMLEENLDLEEDPSGNFDDTLQTHLLLGEAHLCSEDYSIAMAHLQKANSMARAGLQRLVQYTELEVRMSGSASDVEIEELMKECTRIRKAGLTRPNIVITISLKRAEALRLSRRWELASSFYRSVAKKFMGAYLFGDTNENQPPAQDIYEQTNTTIKSEVTTPQVRQVLAGMCECAYHLRHFQAAVEFGTSALAMNRHFPRAHKYVALATLELGEQEEAQKLAAQAVVYESPWDPHHQRRVQQFYQLVFDTTK